jgi:hypothetical protein
VTIPTEVDWGEREKGDFDAEYAHKMFAGKSIAEALAMFRDNVLERAEDVRFMPTIPFRYYMLAFKEYVLSDAALEDEVDAASAADAFLNLVEWRLRQAPRSIVPILTDLVPAVEYVVNHQGRYGANVEIYGDFHERLDRINELRGT